MEVVLVLIDRSNQRSSSEISSETQFLLNYGIKILNTIDSSKARTIGVVTDQYFPVINDLKYKPDNDLKYKPKPEYDIINRYMKRKGVSPMQRFVIINNDLKDGIAEAFMKFKTIETQMRIFDMFPKYTIEGIPIVQLESWEVLRFDNSKSKLEKIHIVGSSEFSNEYEENEWNNIELIYHNSDMKK